MDNLYECCAPGASFKEEMKPVSNNVTVRIITFTPGEKNNNPAIVFVAGWISLIKGWQIVLREMTKDFKVYYIETREKISSIVNRKEQYSLESIGRDIITLISHFNVDEKKYILFGSSLGATAILDCCQYLEKNPLCLVLIGPNAVFSIPKWSIPVIFMFPPRFYLMLKPIVKWYLKTFYLDVESDYAQYAKYCRALDAADPWKLKKAALPLSKYEVWDLLEDIKYPTLIIGASKDVMHIPENLHRMTEMMINATYLDLETNTLTHSKDMVKEMREYIDQLNPPP